MILEGKNSSNIWMMFMGMNLQSQISKVVTKFCMWKLKFTLILFQGLSHASAANSHSTQSTKLKVIWPGIWKHLNQFLVNSALSLLNLGKTCKLCALQHKCKICKEKFLFQMGDALPHQIETQYRAFHLWYVRSSLCFTRFPQKTCYGSSSKTEAVHMWYLWQRICWPICSQQVTLLMLYVLLF